MAFFYSASTRLSLPTASSAAASSTASLNLPQPQPQQQHQPLPNPQIQNHHTYQQLQLQPQPPSHLVAHAMDSSSSTSSHHHRHQQQQQQQSPRPLQGPRPAPLKVRKDSYKIKKPPVAPHHHPSGSGPPNQHPASQQQQQQQQQLPRQPVIIYTVSPKVIHAKPGDFMSLVQRLTGVNSSPTAAAAAAAESQQSPGAFPSPGPAGAMSPAAKLATIEKVHQQSAAEYLHHPYRSAAAGGAGGDLDSLIEQFETTSSSAAATAVLDYRTANNNLPFPPPAILSPNPSSLPAISPSFFAPDSDLSFLQNFLNGLSPMAGAAAAAAAAAPPVLPAPTATSAPAPPPPPASASPITNRGGFIDSSFLLSPSATASHLAFASSLLAPSPGGFWDRPSGFGFTPNAGAQSPNWDLFGHFPDL